MLDLILQLLAVSMFAMSWYPCPDCCGEPCTACTEASDTDSIDVTFSGVANNDCANCTDFNTTFTLTRQDGDCEGQYPCCWNYDFAGTPDCSNLDLISLTLGINGGTFKYSWRVRVVDTSGFTDGQGDLDTGDPGLPPDPVDCSSQYSISMFDSVGVECSWNGATCTVNPP